MLSGSQQISGALGAVERPCSLTLQAQLKNAVVGRHAVAGAQALERQRLKRMRGAADSGGESGSDKDDGTAPAGGYARRRHRAARAVRFWPAAPVCHSARRAPLWHVSSAPTGPGTPAALQRVNS